MRGADEDYSMATKARLIERLRVLLAGRAAEEVQFPISISLRKARQSLWAFLFPE